MIDQLPDYILWAFGLTTMTTVVLLYWTIKSSTSPQTKRLSIYILIGSVIWLVVQAALTLSNVYNSDLVFLPPKIVLFGIGPMIITGFVCFLTESGRRFMDSLPLVNLTYLSVVRIPVEIVLLWLFYNKVIPELMTFEGWNFDIIAGLTAPLVAYFGFTRLRLSRIAILTWNVICLGLLINIIVIALFSTPSPLQQFAFDQPNIALLHFPFSWLPTYVVPIVVFTHLASIRQLLSSKSQDNSLE